MPGPLPQSGAKLDPVGEQQQAHLPLSDQSWPHSLLPATLSASLGHREELLRLPVDCLFPRLSPGLPAECHSPAGVYYPAKVPCLQLLCQLGKEFHDQARQGTEFPFLSDQIFPPLVPPAAIFSPLRKLQSQDLPGKEIRTASKNSVANHYSHCLDSPLLGLPSSLMEDRPRLKRILAQEQEKEIPPGLVPQQ